MKLVKVKEGEIFRYKDHGWGYSVHTPLLRGRIASDSSSFVMVRCYENIVDKSKSVLIPGNAEVVVIGRVYKNHKQ